MTITVTEVEELRQYIDGVMNRADHHASNVRDIVLALVGAITWRKDDEEPIQVMGHNGKMNNVLWVRIGGRRYAFSYNHLSGEIEMRQGSTQGPTLHTFSNATPLATIRTIFAAL